MARQAKIYYQNELAGFSKQTDKVADLIAKSFLTDEYKERYLQIFEIKLKQIKL